MADAEEIVELSEDQTKMYVGAIAGMAAGIAAGTAYWIITLATALALPTGGLSVVLGGAVAGLLLGLWYQKSRLPEKTGDSEYTTLDDEAGAGAAPVTSFISSTNHNLSTTLGAPGSGSMFFSACASAVAAAGSMISFFCNS